MKELTLFLFSYGIALLGISKLLYYLTKYKTELGNKYIIAEKEIELKNKIIKNLQIKVAHEIGVKKNCVILTKEQYKALNKQMGDERGLWGWLPEEK